ncbi:putative acid phosphatase [Trypanosoma theileri]|uniref:Putative acid phosphatase n=1 Tax=Trypanosoma theileri TaxID=67003 RepID=A0A1X0P7L7_9TRYP|nr:putative acid phosphatase [Trypanosoma theileri]ORC92924.1 putative acid phosphatase [Trypanosoma theileri]
MAANTQRPLTFFTLVWLVLLLHLQPTIAESEEYNRQHQHSAAVSIPQVNKTKSNSDKKELQAFRKKNNLIITKLIVISRHGHRAPNAPYWDMCPNDRKNRRKYNVDAEDLTGLGMKEVYEFGEYVRQTYHHFIGNRFNRSLHFFRAVGEPRILQSAIAMSQGLFPDGYGPGGFLPSRPQFVPVFSDMDTHEYLLDNVPCFRRAEADVQHWINSSMDAFMQDENVVEVVKYMKKACGFESAKAKVKKRPLYAFIKTVADGMTFNADYGLNVCRGRVTPEMLFRIRNISLQLLMARLYHTDEQQTYTAVDLPQRLLRLLHHKHPPKPQYLNDFVDTRQEATFYFVHREALYALAQFFGFSYNLAGLPHGELPVASSLIVEKLEPGEYFNHRNKDHPAVTTNTIETNDSDSDSADDKKHAVKAYVRLLLWTPNDGRSTVEISRCKIPQLCTVEELEQIYTERVNRTGTWEKLCNYTYFELDHNTDIR